MQSSFKEVLSEIITLLTTHSDSLTLFELEHSGILLALCSYFESNFINLNNLIIENEATFEQKLNIDAVPPYIKENKYIYEKTKMFFDLLNNNKSHFTSLINLLQYTITSMNCFTMVVDEAISTGLNVFYTQIIKDTKVKEVVVTYKQELFNLLLNEKELSQGFKEKLREYDEAFQRSKDIKLLITPKTLFKDMTSALLSHSGVSFNTNAEYDVVIKYQLEINVKGKVHVYDIDNNWSYAQYESEKQMHISKLINEMKKEMIDKKEQTNKDKDPISNLMSILCKIKYGLSYNVKKQNKDDDNRKNEDSSNANNANEIPLSSQQNENYIIFKSLNEILKQIPLPNETDNYNIEKYIFKHIYHSNIIFNPNLYEIKRLMPSLFLLTMLYIPLTRHSALFNINPHLFTKDEIDSLFVNSKVSLLISRSCRDGYSISRDSIPSWCQHLSNNFCFLSKFPSRHILFKVSFEPRRSLLNLQNHLRSIDPSYVNETPISISKSMRLKIIIERDKIFEYGLKIINDTVTSQFAGYLEFEYLNEIGNGIGPTLEFYHLIINALREEKELWYKTTDGSLYPRIFKKGTLTQATLNKYKLLGFVIARALYDDRLIEVPLSRVFWDVVLNRGTQLSDISVFDKDLGKTIQDFIDIIKRKEEFITQHKGEEKLNELLEKNVTYNGCNIKELDLYFTLPGYDDIELKEN